MADLVVELYGTPTGLLTGTWHDFDFLPDPATVARFGIDSPVLSVAIPLTAVAVRSRKGRRQNFFRELLPEGRILTVSFDLNRRPNSPLPSVTIISTLVGRRQRRLEPRIHR